MCGILVNVGEEEITADHPALDIIRHRGPDDNGAITFDLTDIRVGLGHRRLSIIDLSERGKQPMGYTNRYWITYNGEIYNYLEIRKELEADGFAFKTESDTEVLLAAWIKWGADCLKRFNGMFAFCIYDTSERKMFFARDRFGIKPLYFLNNEKCLRLGSEIKQFASTPGYSPTINKDKLFHFLNTGDFDYDRESLWQGVNEIQGGHYVALDLSKWRPGDHIEQVCWYKPDFSVDESITFEDAVSEFRRLLNQSVKFRLRADVPVGFLLSGGLDSSTLVGIAHTMPREDGASLRVYSSCYDDPSIDEREYIKAVIEHNQADACLHFPKIDDVTANFDKVIWHNDIPVVHGSPIPHSLIYQHIKGENDARKVILEGQGADEILCGYGDFHWAALYELFSPWSAGSFIKEMAGFRKHHQEPWKTILRKWYRMKWPDSVKYPVNSALDMPLLIGTEKIPQRPVRREEPNVPLLHRDRLIILKYILHNVDRNSMAQSRETRVPFLDHELVDFCLKLPTRHKISSGVTKRVLREAVKDVLPDKVKKRTDKQGYSSPVPMWASGELKHFFREHLPKSAERPFINRKKLMDSYNAFEAGSGHFDPIWWRCIAADHWIDMFKMSF